MPPTPPVGPGTPAAQPPAARRRSTRRASTVYRGHRCLRAPRGPPALGQEKTGQMSEAELYFLRARLRGGILFTCIRPWGQAVRFEWLTGS